MKVLVAMSGGIDSSVVAHLLKHEGHEVVGVRFTLWQDPLAPALAKVLPTKCCDTQTISRAHAVAKDLEIPLHAVDLRKEFKETVVDPFLESYRKGFTPNPCVLCNKIFKFEHLIRMADTLGCEKVATGHYARIVERKDKNEESYSALLEAEDVKKDQSYYLYRLGQKELARTLLPLGNIFKKEVFTLAKKFKVPVERETYKESQDLCFFPEKSPKDFLKRYITNARPGPIMTIEGTEIGTHEGIPYYTIGQRRGLKVGGQSLPMYIVRKEQKSNTVFLSDSRALMKYTAHISLLSFTRNPPREDDQMQCEMRIRSLGRKMKGTFIRHGDHGTIQFDRPTAGITPGQSLVLYHDDEVIGGGIFLEDPVD